MTELTICSVSYLNKDCLDLNYSLTTVLNPGSQYKWIVVENNLSDSSQRISPSDNRFAVQEGVATHVTSRARGSYHHAGSLNSALASVKSRYLVALDPDFFIVRPNWINDALEHMQQRGIVLLGAPYHPQYHKFYRYVPSASCVIIDLKYVDQAKFDFRPEFEGVQAMSTLGRKELIRLLAGPDQKIHKIHPEATREMVWYALTDRFLKPFQRDILRKTKYVPGGLRDTGYRFKHLAKQLGSHRTECFVPAWVNPIFDTTKSGSQSITKKIWQRWLVPERLSLYPKRRNYTTTAFFRDFGFPNIDGYGWEEYFWRERPFGFHLRGFSHDRMQFDIEQLRSTVHEMMSRYAGAQQSPDRITV